MEMQRKTKIAALAATSQLSNKSDRPAAIEMAAQTSATALKQRQGGQAAG